MARSWGAIDQNCELKVHVEQLQASCSVMKAFGTIHIVISLIKMTFLLCLQSAWRMSPFMHVAPVEVAAIKECWNTNTKVFRLPCFFRAKWLSLEGCRRSVWSGYFRFFFCCTLPTLAAWTKRLYGPKRRRRHHNTMIYQGTEHSCSEQLSGYGLLRITLINLQKMAVTVVAITSNTKLILKLLQ